MLVGSVGGGLVEHELSPALIGDRGERALLGWPEPERLLDQQRLVDEVGIGCNQCDPGGLAGEVMQREQGLNAGDTAAETTSDELLVPSM